MEINQIIGELVTRERYRFAPPGLVADVVRAVYEIKNLDRRTTSAQIPDECRHCILNDMTAACKHGDEACKLFHRRLAGLVNGVAELAQCHPKSDGGK